MVDGSETLTDYLERLAAGLRDVLGHDLVGVYLHGSGALGGFRSESSDVDVMVIVARPLDLQAKSAVVRKIWAMADGPGRGLECWVMTKDTVQSGWERPEAELFVSTHRGEPMTRDGPDMDGPFPLVEIAIMRKLGVTIIGPAPGELIAPISHAAICRDMTWHLEFELENTPESYGVLNACRSLLYVETGRHVSKIDGGEWALSKGLAPSLVRNALDAQLGRGMDRPLTRAGRRFIEDTIRVLKEAS